METQPQSFDLELSFRHPNLNDGMAIHKLIAESPPLDLNSSYLYFLQASHFAETCMVAEYQNEIVGFISGYLRPDRADSLFIWQVAVAAPLRGQGLAQKMLSSLANKVSQQSEVKSICCTISPSNKASQGLFYRFAEKNSLMVDVEDFIDEQLFGNSDHEAEQLYTLTTVNKQALQL